MSACAESLLPDGNSLKKHEVLSRYANGNLSLSDAASQVVGLQVPKRPMSFWHTLALIATTLVIATIFPPGALRQED